ncbi:unnamed protein product [Triticum turgidum subsp. durum]|uniref:Fungal lipase-like domain-containing protein n=1 Tax=Triticum turgidum subsp. durum TaxID=4567 RepID=A0A9R0XLT1_TRITD|nr:unnamed protein product [Triticum turgidum subsp. durum]
MDLGDHFERSGPTHLMARTIDWDKEEHRRCVAASLVNSTYVMEKDRRRWSRAQLAPAWWTSFHFHLEHTRLLEDEHSIFGAIYRHVPPPPGQHHPSAPHYIVAFRGTMLRHMVDDMHLNVQIMTNTVHDSIRSQRAHAAVRNLLAAVDSRYIVWLAGHSQGASLALEVGRDLMRNGRRNLPTFLFNLPHVSLAPVINLTHSAADDKRELYVLSNLVKAELGKVLPPHRKRMEQLFEQLSSWAPKLYVHEKDFICQGFIDYFEQREQLERRFRGAARFATVLSYRDMLIHLLGVDKEPRPHLLPSATLWKNSTGCRLRSHRLKLWWKPDSELRLTQRRHTY